MKFFLSYLLIALLLTSCEKSLENFRENPVAVSDTIWATVNNSTLEINQLQTQLKRSAVVDSFSIATGSNLQTPNGLRVEVPANAFAGSLTGIAQSELIFLRTKGDLIRLGKPTVSNGAVLQTASTIYVNISKNGQSLSLLNGNTIRLTVSDSITTNSLRIYTGETPALSGFSVFNWRQSDSLSVSVTNSGYHVLSNRQQWLCLASGLDTTSQKSRVVLSMPAQYTNANTQAFIVFKDVSSVVQLAPDADRRIWLTEKIPTGKNVLYVTITKKGSDYWLGTQDAVTALNQNVHITPQKKSLQSINDFLDGL